MKAKGKKGEAAAAKEADTPFGFLLTPELLKSPFASEVDSKHKDLDSGDEGADCVGGDEFPETASESESETAETETEIAAVVPPPPLPPPTATHHHCQKLNMAAPRQSDYRHSIKRLGQQHAGNVDCRAVAVRGGFVTKLRHRKH